MQDYGRVELPLYLFTGAEVQMGRGKMQWLERWLQRAMDIMMCLCPIE